MNYKSISLVAHVGKVLLVIVADCLIAHLEENNLRPEE